MYRADVICHSISPRRHELLSFVIEFPRKVLAEVVTHRCNYDQWGYEEVSFSERTTTPDISKNSGSSRAIPYIRLLKKIETDPYIPERFSKDGRGMQGHGWLEGEDHTWAVAKWLEARDAAIKYAGHLWAMGVHKQDVNRLLEPWAWVTQVVTATKEGLNNFFALRCHKDADPAFQKIARLMFLAARKSTPTTLDYNEWHLPFIKPEEKDGFKWTPNVYHQELPDLLQFSAARCAWVSYENHNKDGTAEQMKATFQRLVGQIPRHASPLEHQGSPMHASWEAAYRHLCSNLHGWIQARKLLKDEKITEFNPSDEEIASWGLST